MCVWRELHLLLVVKVVFDPVDQALEQTDGDRVDVEQRIDLVPYLVQLRPFPRCRTTESVRPGGSRIAKQGGRRGNRTVRSRSRPEKNNSKEKQLENVRRRK